MADFASAVTWVSILVEVPMFSVKGLEFSASVARLPPLTAPEFAPTVDSLVISEGDKLKISKSVVLLVSVPMVDAVSGRDRPICLLPVPDVGKDVSRRLRFWIPDGESVVTLGGGMSSSARVL